MKTHDTNPGRTNRQPAASLTRDTGTTSAEATLGGASAQHLALQAYIDRSPRMLAQRRTLHAAFGNAIQREEEKSALKREDAPLQAQMNPVANRSLLTIPPPPQGHERAVVQRRIGDGGSLLQGRMVVDAFGRKYEIVGHQMFQNRLEYKLQTEGGSTRLVRADDDAYQLYAGYKGVFGFDGREQERTPIEFTIKRRDGGPRTTTVFANVVQATAILVKQCDVPAETAKQLIATSDWSYPMVRHLIQILSTDGTLQPGLDEGGRLWEEAQPEKVYTIRTTGIGSQLAQLVGCHLMEFQETNNGTQGPKQSKDVSRQQQLELTRAILALPADQVAKHAIGLGQPQYVKQFPAPFDIKFEGDPLFGRNAGTSTFKIYQSAIKMRDTDFDHTDTLLGDARQDRKLATRAALAKTEFNVDQMELSAKPDEDFIHSHLGLKDTDSDYSMEEDDDWKPPLTMEVVGTWTLEQLHEYVFKHNVYSGVLFKDYAAKLAELDILETETPHTYEKGTLSTTRERRQGVQEQVQRADLALWNIMQALQINVVTLYTRLSQWKEKSALVASKNSIQAQAYKRSLQEYSRKRLAVLRDEGYPPPLDGIGQKTLEKC